MQSIRAGILVVGVMLLCAPQAGAEKLYKWVDAEGQVTYQDSPPPRGIEFEEQQYQEPPSIPSLQQMQRAAAENPVVLYAVPECDSCDLVRYYLEQRGIPFSEKSVHGNTELQRELEKKTGRLEVPVLAVGERLVEGYSRTAIAEALRGGGFPLEEIERAPARGAEEEQRPREQ